MTESRMDRARALLSEMDEAGVRVCVIREERRLQLAGATEEVRDGFCTRVRQLAPEVAALAVERAGHEATRIVVRDHLRWLARELGRIAPPGLATSDEWEGLVPVMDRVLDALSEYDEEPCPETAAKVDRATDEALLAWREAARRFEDEGRAEDRTEVPA